VYFSLALKIPFPASEPQVFSVRNLFSQNVSSQSCA
jgi:hypothetical protein